MALYDNSDGCPVGSVMKDGICLLATPSDQEVDTQKNPAEEVAKWGNILTGLGGAAGQVICALKGTCKGDTVIHQTPQQPPKDNSAIWGALAIGVPIAGILGLIIYQLVKKK